MGTVAIFETAGAHKRASSSGRPVAGAGRRGTFHSTARFLSDAGNARSWSIKSNRRRRQCPCNVSSSASQWFGNRAVQSQQTRAAGLPRTARGGALGASCDIAGLSDVISQGLDTLPHNLAMLPHFMLGVGVGLPCTVMDCGDVIHRSTLPKPTALQLTYGGVTLVSLIAAYLWATPGVAPGFWDMFVLSPLENFIRPKYTQVCHIVMGQSNIEWPTMP